MWFSFSALLVGASLAAIAFFGLNAGIDFTGGTQVEITFSNEKPSPSEVKSLFESAVGTQKGEKIVAKLDGTGYLIRSRNLSEDEIATLTNALQPNGIIEKTNTIGSTVGSVFKKRAFLAVGLSILAIILFVAFAFRSVPHGLSSWKFGMAAIVALVHDITIIIGLFALLGYFFGVEVDALFITALLTVLGFSVNDTIVIFDRIRENLKGKKASNLGEVAEKAVWQSMRRSINTSVSTIIVIATMLVFFTGFPDLFFFFLTLGAGITVGTYSSIFLAAPLLLSWHTKK